MGKPIIKPIYVKESPNPDAAPQVDEQRGVGGNYRRHVGEAIVELQNRFPGIQERLVDDKGEVRRFVNVYVNEEDIRFLQNRETPLKDGDEISIIPAIAGG